MIVPFFLYQKLTLKSKRFITAHYGCFSIFPFISIDCHALLSSCDNRLAGAVLIYAIQ